MRQICLPPMIEAGFGRIVNNSSVGGKTVIDEKQADNAAKKDGTVGKAVNHVKSGYHKNRAKASAKKAKKSLKDAV